MRQIRVLNNNGRCMLRFTHRGQSYSLTQGDYNNRQDRADMAAIAARITADIQSNKDIVISDYRVLDPVLMTPERLKADLAELTSKEALTVAAWASEWRRGTFEQFAQGSPLKASTKRRYLTTLKKLLPQWKKALCVTLKAAKGEKKEIRPFDSNEVSKILSLESDPYWSAFITFLMHTGCRPSEALALRWSDISPDWSYAVISQSFSIDKESGQRKMKETKTGKTRKVALSKILVNHLLEITHTADDEDEKFVFPTLAPSTMRLSWMRHLEAAGVDYRPIYNCRHTWITHALMSGADVITVAAQAGNSPRIIWQHYAGILTQQQLISVF